MTTERKSVRSKLCTKPKTFLSTLICKKTRIWTKWGLLSMSVYHKTFLQEKLLVQFSHNLKLHDVCEENIPFFGGQKRMTDLAENSSYGLNFQATILTSILKLL